MPAQITPYDGQTTGSAQDLKEKATDQFEKIADKATDKFRDVADRAEHIASRVAEQGREVGDKVQEVAGNLKGAVKDQPMATLAIPQSSALSSARSGNHSRVSAWGRHQPSYAVPIRAAGSCLTAANRFGAKVKI